MVNISFPNFLIRMSMPWTSSEAVAQRCSVKKVVLLEISQNSQENTCARVFF